MKRSLTHGMTLVEIILTVSIIGMLAAVMVPAFQAAMRGRQNALCARKLQIAVQAFEQYALETGGYPPDQVVPGQVTVPAMEAYFFPYFKMDWWGATNELGGRWDWDVGYHGFAQSVSIWNPTVPDEQMMEFDNLIDDGNLATGTFRKVGSQYHFIVRE